MIGSRLELSDIEFSVECLPEDTPIRGNLIESGDDEFDVQQEDIAIEQLNDGNQWAWCAVQVVGRYKGLTADDYLGCCSYRNKADFMQPGGYYYDMQELVRAELQAQLDDILEGVDKVSE